MNRKDLYQSFNNVEDNNLERSETGAFKRNRMLIKWVSIAACFCLIVSGVIIWVRNEEPTPTAGCMDFFYDIYPTVMVNGELYQWETGCNFMPKGCVYYGEIKHVTTEAPRKNCELASVFDIEGQIYTYEGVYVYVCATTDWLDEQIIWFVPAGQREVLNSVVNNTSYR